MKVYVIVYIFFCSYCLFLFVRYFYANKIFLFYIFYSCNPCMSRPVLKIITVRNKINTVLRQKCVRN